MTADTEPAGDVEKAVQFWQSPPPSVSLDVLGAHRTHCALVSVKPALQRHCVANVLPASNVELLPHGSQGPGPVAALYELAGQIAHVT